MWVLKSRQYGHQKFGMYMYKYVYPSGGKFMCPHFHLCHPKARVFPNSYFPIKCQCESPHHTLSNFTRLTGLAPSEFLNKDQINGDQSNFATTSSLSTIPNTRTPQFSGTPVGGSKWVFRSPQPSKGGGGGGPTAVEPKSGQSYRSTGQISTKPKGMRVRGAERQPVRRKSDVGEWTGTDAAGGGGGVG